jgi:hypothetical protein
MIEVAIKWQNLARGLQILQDKATFSEELKARNLHLTELIIM